MADPIASTTRRSWTSNDDSSTPATGTSAVPKPPTEPPHDAIRSYSLPPLPAAPLQTTGERAIAGSGSPDIAMLPDSLLDRQASALRARLGRPADYAERTADKAELTRVEGELSRRGLAARPPVPSPTPSPAPSGGHVELCKRNANIPVAGPLGLQHHWLETSTKEAGMGPARGNIPGHGASLEDMPGDPTRINDHSGETEKHCEPVPGVTEECINERLRIGQYTGRWTPPLNDCQTFVADVIADCRRENIEAALAQSPRGNEPVPTGRR